MVPPPSPLSGVPRRTRLAGRAFSLLELLAICAVLGVLVLLLVPSLAGLRDRVETSECLANLRQIGLTLRAYADDHDGRIPKAGISPWYQENTWGYELWPYAYDSYKTFTYYGNCLTFQRPETGPWKKNIFRCPSTKHRQVSVPTAADRSPGYSYGLNTDPAGQSYNRNIAIKLANVPNPSKVCMVTETSQATGDYQGYYLQFGLMPHNGGSDILFYDGHVEWRKFEAIPGVASDVFWDAN